MIIRILLAAFAVISMLGGTAQAQKSGKRWVLVGTADVDMSRGRQTIDVSKAKGAFKALRLELRKGNLVLNNIEVKYAGGQIHDERRDINLLTNERTRPINPVADDRFVDSVELFMTGTSANTASVEIYGLQSAKGATLARLSTTNQASGQIPAVPDKGKAAPVVAKPGAVSPNGDILFGVEYAGFVRDRDVIQVGPNFGQFERIRLRVLDNDIFINDMDVVYTSGETDRLVLNGEVKQNTRTKWFNVKADKFIKEIRFTYRSKPNFKGQARVEVYGELASGWTGANGRGKSFNEGWVVIGAQSVNRFFRNENDVIPIGRNEGGFKRLRLTVKDRAIVLSELRVVYGDGQEDVFTAKGKIEPGTTFGPVDLKGDTSRFIKEIRARYRSAVFDSKATANKPAVVEIWAQH